MSTSQIFNLEKIKELTNPIEDLQVELNHLNNTAQKVTKNFQKIEKESLDENFLTQIEVIKNLLITLNDKLNKISRTNLSKFLVFQDNLIQKYKENFKNNIKRIKVDEDLTKKIGLFLIEEKKTSKIIDFVSFFPSLEIPQWLELLDSLKYNTLFSKSINRVRIYYQEFLEIRLKNELSRIPRDIDPNLINEYKKFFKDNPNVEFNEYLQIIENQLTKKELDTKKEIIRKVKEKEELEKLIKKQEEQKKTYEEYLKLSDREFKRLRRKKSREKLTDVSKKSSEINSIEISDEVSEKIKKFKSSLDKSFNEKYMIQKDEDQDPLDLIRERKKRKEKEYKQYRDHFENSQ